MFGFNYINFPKISKLFLMLLALGVFQQNILVSQEQPAVQEQVTVQEQSTIQGQFTGQEQLTDQENLTDQADSQIAKKNIGDVPELVEKLEDKNGDLDINSMQDFFQQMLQIWAEAKKREEERKALFFSKLSPKFQEILKISQARYNKFLEDVDIRNGLAELCRNARGGLEKLKDSLNLTPKMAGYFEVETVLIEIERLQTAIALDYCRFLPKRMKGMSSKGIEDLSGAMNGLMQNLMPDGQDINALAATDDVADAELENSDLAFSIKDVGNFCESLNELLKSGIFEHARKEEQELSDLKTKTENFVGILNDILSSILSGKSKDLILCYVTYLEPEFNEATRVLKETQKAFELEVKAYIANQSGNVFENEKDLSETDLVQKAYIFWFKEIKKYQRTLLVFSTLKGSATSVVAGTEKLFETVAYAYDVASCFYGFYKNDMDAPRRKAQYKLKHNTPLTMGEQEALAKVSHWSDKDVLIPKAIDWGFSSFMASWFFCLKRPDAVNNLLLQSMFGNMPLNMVDVKQATVLNFMVAPFAMIVLLSPSALNWQPPKALKALGKVAGAWAYYNIFYSKLFGSNNISCWDADYENLKDSTYDLLIEVEKVVSDLFARTIRSNTRPESLEKIENLSLGVIKPEMIGYFTEAMIPLLLSNQYENTPSPIFGYRDDDFLKSKAGKYCVAEYDNFTEAQKRDVSFKNYYVEACISYYVASSVGRTLGASLARRLQGPCLNAAAYAGGKCLDGLAWLHIIGEDTREMFTALGDEFSEGFEENMMILKMLFKEVFAPNSPFKNLLVFHLRKRGDIEIGKNYSEEEVNLWEQVRILNLKSLWQLERLKLQKEQSMTYLQKLETSLPLKY